jgi:hypothetical protein
MASGVIGTGVAQPPVQMLATASAFLAKIPADILGDEISKPSPVLWAMTRRGKMGGAGAAINYAAWNAFNTNRGAYYGDQLLNNSVVDVVQPIEQQWKFNYQGVAIPITDMILQSGSGMTGIRDLMENQVVIACASFTDYLSNALWHTSPANTSLDVDDLDSWIGQTTNTIGGVSRSSNTWWQPQANLATASGTSLAVADAEKGYQQCGYGYDYPDILCMNPNPYAVFKGNFTNNIRYLDPDDQAPDGSFPEHFVFNKCVVLVDRLVPAGAAYFFNSKYIYPKFHEADYFTIDPWLKPSRQRVLMTNMYLTWNIICPAPRLGGIKLTGVGT